jgi:hypothetical protein
MRIKLIALTLTALVLTIQGCASGFRAGGRRVGVEAGTAVAPPAGFVTPLPVPDGVPSRLPPPPPPQEAVTAYPTRGAK